MKKIALSVVAIVGMSSFGFADANTVPVDQVDESSYYIGLGIAATSSRNSEVSLNFSNIENNQDRTANVTLLAGYDITEYVAVEGRYTTSIAQEDHIEMSGWSIFLKPQYRFEDENGEKNNFTIYALLGFGGVTMDGIDGWDAAVDDTGFQWGLGASYSFKEYADDHDISIFVDYTNLANDVDGIQNNVNVNADSDAITVGIAYRF